MYDYSPEGKFYQTPTKRSVKAEFKDLRVMKMDPGRGKYSIKVIKHFIDLFDSIGSKVVVTKIFSGTVGALNTLPSELREHDLSSCGESDFDMKMFEFESSQEQSVPKIQKAAISGKKRAAKRASGAKINKRQK